MMDSMLHVADEISATSPQNFLGILYAEDFDETSDPVPERAPPPEPSPPPPPVFTQADVDDACAAAIRAAEREWRSSQEQLQLNAVSALATVLSGAHAACEAATLKVAEGTVTTMLSVLTGLLPHFCREHGPAEVQNLLDRLLPTIRSKTRISVRVHPDLVHLLQRDISGLEPDLAGSIDIVAASLERGDVKVSWENGSMTRDSRQIIQAVEDALGQLGLRKPVEAPAKRRMAYAD